MDERLSICSSSSERRPDVNPISSTNVTANQKGGDRFRQISMPFPQHLKLTRTSDVLAFHRTLITDEEDQRSDG